MDGDSEQGRGFDDLSADTGVWRYAKASRASVIVDAADYFDLMQQAMLAARRRVLLIGWDFDTRIHLAHGRRWYGKRGKGRYPRRLGSFILWLVRHRRKLEVRILKWSYGVLTWPFRGSMVMDLLRWFPNRRIDFKFDTHHPVGCSHHQKIAVLDDRVGVCGGIDMTTGRWDTREHCEGDKRRSKPRGGYYGPWHDATMMVEGEVAGALAALGDDRWAHAGGTPLGPVEGGAQDIWPAELAAQFENVEIGIARTRAEYCGRRAVTEIEELYLAHIARARHFIYAESQYFASRRVAEAIALRVAEPDPPEILLVNPAHAEGWLEQEAMDTARARLSRSIGLKDHKKRFNIVVPFSGEEPIYVHAKLMIVDDKILRIGSSNLNNRSMRLDSECDLFIDCARPGNEGACDAIAGLRHSLLAEHLGLRAEEIGPLLAQHGSMIELVKHCSGGRRQLRRLDLPELTAIEADMADNALLDPEHPEEFFEPIAKRRGLFRKGGILRRPKRAGADG
ncbi:MAG: phospholipase [Sphingomonadales bacterium]|nr:phospholipase [Sphingomonadales bacterium]MBD3774107.1 phospholipase [Paracoccaceae bacterium]